MVVCRDKKAGSLLLRTAIILQLLQSLYCFLIYLFFFARFLYIVTDKKYSRLRLKEKEIQVSDYSKKRTLYHHEKVIHTFC